MRHHRTPQLYRGTRRRGIEPRTGRSGSVGPAGSLSPQFKTCDDCGLSDSTVVEFNFAEDLCPACAAQRPPRQPWVPPVGYDRDYTGHEFASAQWAAKDYEAQCVREDNERAVKGMR